MQKSQSKEYEMDDYETDSNAEENQNERRHSIMEHGFAAIDQNIDCRSSQVGSTVAIDEVKDSQRDLGPRSPRQMTGASSLIANFLQDQPSQISVGRTSRQSQIQLAHQYARQRYNEIDEKGREKRVDDR